MRDNPYEAPRAVDAPRAGRHDYPRAKAALRPPASCLIGLSMLAMVLDLLVLREVIVHDAPKLMGQDGPASGRAEVIGGVAANGSLLVLHAFVFYGSLQMLRVRSYGRALSAAVISLFPFCSPAVLLGIPFGIWALAVLRHAGVKEAFRRGPGSGPDSPGDPAGWTG